MCAKSSTFAEFDSFFMRILLSRVNITFSVLMLFALLTGVPIRAEEVAKKNANEVVALKNNLVYDAIATPNLQLEIKLAHKWSMEVGVGFNPFPLKDTHFPKWRHVAVWVAPRYWLCAVFSKAFVSFNAAYAHYNVAGNGYPIGWMYKQVQDNRYQGDAVMGGLSFGWHFPISPHFSIELEGGADVGYSWYKQYQCVHCGAKLGDGGRLFALPKLGVNLSVPLGGDELSLARRCDCEKIEPKQEPEDEPMPQQIGARRLTTENSLPVEPVVAYVPYFEPKVDNMQKLRSRLLRSEDEYEPYNTDMALSADPRNVFLFFDVNVTKMDRSFIKNDLLMDSIINILGEALEDSNVHISHIQIVGFASFDGRVAYNENLAGSRAQTIKKYMQSVYPQLKDSIFAVHNGGESWAELKYGLSKVEFIGRDEVFRIMDEEPDLDMRERKIKQLHKGKTYIYMRDELKHILRNLGSITIYIEN